MIDSRGDRVLDSTWTRVEQFDPSGPSIHSAPKDAMQVDDEGEDEVSEWEYEDTEELVTLDLGPESKRLLQMSHQYSITGLETTNRVFFRIGNVMFKGHWDQLLGTEILLRDHKDASKPIAFQHEVSPLPATQTDLRTGRAPSTTRHRIQFLPAVNMMAREDALREQGGGSSIPGQPLITHKGGWVWMRGRGWIRKEQANAFGGDIQEDVEAGGKDGDSANSKPKAATIKKKLGRKKMTAEEKMRYSIWKSLQKIEKSKEDPAVLAEEELAGEESEDDDEEEDAGSGSDSGDAEDDSPVQGNGVS